MTSTDKIIVSVDGSYGWTLEYPTAVAETWVVSKDGRRLERQIGMDVMVDVEISGIVCGMTLEQATA